MAEEVGGNGPAAADDCRPRLTLAKRTPCPAIRTRTLPRIRESRCRNASQTIHSTCRNRCTQRSLSQQRKASPRPCSNFPTGRGTECRRQSLAQMLLQKRIQVVYQSSHGTVAIVDSRVIRAGDALDNSRVVEIRLDGIVLERVARLCRRSVSLGVAIPLFAPRSEFRCSCNLCCGRVRILRQFRRIAPCCRFPTSPLAATAKVTDEAVSIVVRNASVRQVLDLIAEEHGWSVGGGYSPQEPFTLSLFDLPLHDVLEVILQPRGLASGAECRAAGDLARARSGAGCDRTITPGGELPAEVLSQANVEPVVSSLLSPHGKTHFAESEGDARSEMLVIDEPAAIERVESYLAQADRPPPHVLIEAHVLRVALNAETWQGVNLLPLAAEKWIARFEGADICGSPDRAASVLPALQATLQRSPSRRRRCSS